MLRNNVKIVNVSDYILMRKINTKTIEKGETDDMELLNKKMTEKKERPVKVLQFGEGNFLRAFVDYMIDIANERGEFDGDIVLVKPIEAGNLDYIKEQDCRYTVQLRGIVDGEPKRSNRIVTSVCDAVDAYKEYEKYASYAKSETLRFVVSNTTEAGIVYDDTDRLEFTPPRTYPGKLTKFLYERYQYFQGAEDKGLIILPVELIDDNGIYLKEYIQKLAVLWKLEEGFLDWVNRACVVTSTLVDRIVTGYPRDEAEEIWRELGYQDRMLVTGEPFALWVIESEKDISRELPLPQAGLPVVFTDNQKPYKQRKVRILNGAHTSFVLASYLCGNDIVLEAMNDSLIYRFMKETIFDEIIPTLTLPAQELIDFANAVIARFQNPYVKHDLLAISLNSVSKWRARCMPSLLGYLEREKTLPAHLAFSLAALMVFYTGGQIRDHVLIGHRDGQEYEIKDDMTVLEFFADHSVKNAEEYTRAVLSHKEFWGQDLSVLPGMEQAVCSYISEIRTLGMRAAIEKIFV